MWKGIVSTQTVVSEVPVKAYAMKALDSQAGSAEGGASPWRSSSVGYFLDLIQIICIQSFYLLI